jgi:anti-sigma factor RsiW
MKRMNSNCTAMEGKLAEMLLDPDAASAKVQTHVAGCEDCRRELNELRATMALMDAWKAPEPSPYFMTRMSARFREERNAAPAGWLARLRASFAYGPRTHVRPLAAMAMTVMLLLGGGTYLGITNWDHPAGNGQAAVVHDLQTMDNNAQLLDQLETISSNNSQTGD